MVVKKYLDNNTFAFVCAFHQAVAEWLACERGAGKDPGSRSAHSYNLSIFSHRLKAQDYPYGDSYQP